MRGGKRLDPDTVAEAVLSLDYDPFSRGQAFGDHREPVLDAGDLDCPPLDRVIFVDDVGEVSLWPRFDGLRRHRCYVAAHAQHEADVNKFARPQPLAFVWEGCLQVNCTGGLFDRVVDQRQLDRKSVV